MTALTTGWHALRRNSDGRIACAYYDADLREWAITGRVLPAGWSHVGAVADLVTVWDARLPAPRPAMPLAVEGKHQ